MTKHYFLEQMNTLLEADIKSLDKDFFLENLILWDSLTRVSSIALVDECFGVSISGIEIELCKTVGDFITLVEKKSGVTL